LFDFHPMNPNYINECIKIVGEHNKHENVIAMGWVHKKVSILKAKPNEIGFHLLIAMWFRSRPNIGA
jgi:hypothetical protein